MKRILGIIVCLLGMHVYAIHQEPVTAPTTTMQSVNNPSYMSTGSAYSPTVQEVGAPAPAAAPIRKAPPAASGTADTDPTNPQFSPIGDAVLPLMLMALAFGGVIALRRRKLKASR